MILRRDRYVADPVNDHQATVRMWHLDGVAWHQATLPAPDHTCWPQTKGLSEGTRVDRCACGATRLDGWGPWLHKNETLRDIEAKLRDIGWKNG